jgi:hypothetical protein
MKTHLRFALASVIVSLSFATHAAAQSPALPLATGLFDWGMKLPTRAVPRRVEQGGVRLEVGKPLVVANIAGAGCIRRIWMTGVFPGRQYVLRMYFDDARDAEGNPVPHVEAPLSDFFGVMHNLAGYYESYRINTPFFAVKPKNGFTCYLPMPFAKSARIEIVREAMEGEPDGGDIFYYLVDWHEYPDGKLDEPQRFCARWRRESPVRDYADDFIVIDADGPGRLVGFVHSIDMLESRFKMRWSHAGADNLYIDGDGPHPAYLRGIGGEDSFGTSFGGNEYQPGTSLFSDMPYYVQKDGEGDKQKLVGYRFFVEDAITFEKSVHLRFGSRAHDIATTVYWYSASPVRPYYRLPPIAQRMPGSVVRRGDYDLPFPNTGRWWIAGPYDVTSPPEWPSRDFDAKQPLAGRAWREAEAIRGFVEFNHAFRPEATNKNSPTLVDCGAVARCVLVSDRATTAKLTLGWDDRLWIAVNGEAPRDLGEQAYLQGRTIEVPLQKGPNSIDVRVTNTTGLTRGAWNFSFSAVTAEGVQLVPQRDE